MEIIFRLKKLEHSTPKEVSRMPVLLLKNQKKNVGKLEICNQTEISADLNIFGDIVSDDWGKW